MTTANKRNQSASRGIMLGLTLAGLMGTTALALAQPNLIYFTWAGYDLPEFHPAYAEKYGGEPSYSYFPDSEEAFQKVRQGFAGDVVHPCLPHIRRWQSEGLLEPIKTEKVTAWQDLSPALTGNPSVSFEGQSWMVPWEWGASSLIYRSDKVADPHSYAVMLDPQYQGRIAIPDNVDEMSMLATLLAGVEDPYELSEDDYEAVSEQMRKLVGQSRFLWTDATTVNQAMASGEIDMFWGWPNTWVALEEAGVPATYMSDPDEGIISWACGFVISRDAKADEEEIYDFINAATAPEAGAALIRSYAYGHSNLKSFEGIDAEALEKMGLAADVGAMLSKSNMLMAREDAQRRRMIELWEQAKLLGGAQ